LRTISFYDFSCREENLWGISKYLKYERMLDGIMSEYSFSEKGIVMETIGTIKL
jgi:hypothetical protein